MMMMTTIMNTALNFTTAVTADMMMVAAQVANSTVTTTTSAVALTTVTIAAVATNSSSNATTTACEMCGWLAAIGSMLAFGSFGVPIKSEACQRLQVDPLVFQSYKTAMCFFTSWLILFFGYEFTFTPWGIVSGLFWVPGGVATIYAVQCAGLALAIGIGSTGIVLVSFIWGIFIFHEPVHSTTGACFAVSLMMLGLYGMAHFSTPTITTSSSNSNDDDDDEPSTVSSSLESSHHVNETTVDPNNGTTPLDSLHHSKRRNRKSGYQRVLVQGTDDDDDALDNDDDALHDDDNHIDGLVKDPSYTRQDTASSDHRDGLVRDFGVRHQDSSDLHVITNDSFEEPHHHIALPSNSDAAMMVVITLWNGRVVKLPRRQVGICAAIFNGAWGGSIMAPMKWGHREDTTGIGFLLSFAIGASIVNVALWVLRYVYLVLITTATTTTTTTNTTAPENQHHNKWRHAYHLLPSFHLRELWCAGGTCGLLWSIGNFFSLISVQYLGQGVGYSVIQASMLVAGLWGICYFREVTRLRAIMKWFLSALLTVSGILLLSYEHHAVREDDGHDGLGA